MPRNVGQHVGQKRRTVTHSTGETESNMAKRAGNRLIGLAAEPHTPSSGLEVGNPCKKEPQACDLFPIASLLSEEYIWSTWISIEPA